MTASLTALQLAEKFRSGEVSPVDAARDALDAIERVDGHLNSICHTDPDATLRLAREAEQRYRDGAPIGPIDGVPTTIKDIFYTRGVPTLRGSRLLADKPDAADPAAWPDDAPVTAATREAGCVVIGKTTTPEFAWKGVTDNTLTGIIRQISQHNTYASIEVEVPPVFCVHILSPEVERRGLVADRQVTLRFPTTAVSISPR